MLAELAIGQLYSNDEIFRSLKVSNAGGIRLSIADKAVLRATIMTSDENFHGARENPYHDRLEGGILTYTAAGKLGQQTLAGANSRLIEQKIFNFPIHGFSLIASRRDRSVGAQRWKYLGLLEYLRHYPDIQLDADGKVRTVWLFEFKVHDEHQVLPLAVDGTIAKQVLTESRLREANNSADDDIVDEGTEPQTENIKQIEEVRGRLLAMEPRGFEVFVKELLLPLRLSRCLRDEIHCRRRRRCKRKNRRPNLDLRKHPGSSASEALAALGREERSRRVARQSATICERRCADHEPFLKGSYQRGQRRRKESNCPC
jgi:hypothetical protein